MLKNTNLCQFLIKSSLSKGSTESQDNLIDHLGKLRLYEPNEKTSDKHMIYVVKLVRQIIYWVEIQINASGILTFKDFMQMSV